LAVDKREGAFSPVLTQAEIICGFGFLRGVGAAAQPLAGISGAGKRDGANGAVIGDDRRPHIETETPIAGYADGAIERRL
jgi:hypothetical protein